MDIVWTIPRAEVDEKKPVTLLLFTLKRKHVWREIQNTSLEAALEKAAEYACPPEVNGVTFPAEIFGWVGGRFQTVAKIN